MPLSYFFEVFFLSSNKMKFLALVLELTCYSTDSYSQFSDLAYQKWWKYNVEAGKGFSFSRNNHKKDKKHDINPREKQDFNFQHIT